MAALGFFVLQGVLGIFLVEEIRMRLGQAIVLAYAGAGAIVVGATLLMFWRSRVVGILSAVGLAGPRDGRRARAILIGIGLGLFAALAGFEYLRLLRLFPDLDPLRGRAEMLAAVRGWWLVLLAVIAAPLFEEFIFRGLVFRGMRRSLPAAWSIAGSAAVFAICHPPVSVLPVFLMAVLGAVGFELTGWLLTPICVHMMYNGLLLLTGFSPYGSHL
jgi:membrane protease YdiL (CAAX protease family)